MDWLRASRRRYFKKRVVAFEGNPADVDLTPSDRRPAATIPRLSARPRFVRSDGPSLRRRRGGGVPECS
jgi:hypothetical protein